jgi:insertion element IS1 protein InsB
VDRERKQVLHAVVGARDEATGACLFASLARPTFQLVCTDHYAAYRHLVPVRLHYRTKAETTSVARCISLLRHYLARFRRRSIGYSKCKRLLLQAVLLLRAKKNETLSMRL